MGRLSGGRDEGENETLRRLRVLLDVALHHEQGPKDRAGRGGPSYVI